MFEKETGHKAVITATSMGILYALLKEGAPFDLFLSGDSSTPIKIEQEGLGIAKTRFSYAIGKLVLWSPNPNLVDKKGEVVLGGKGNLRNSRYAIAFTKKQLVDAEAVVEEGTQGWVVMQFAHLTL